MNNSIITINKSLLSKTKSKKSRKIDINNIPTSVVNNSNNNCNVSNFNNIIKTHDNNQHRTINFSNIKSIESLNIHNKIILKDNPLSSDKNGSNSLNENLLDQDRNKSTFFNSSLLSNKKRMENFKIDFDNKVEGLELNETNNFKNDGTINMKIPREINKNLIDNVKTCILNTDCLDKKKSFINHSKYRNRLNLKKKKNILINKEILIPRQIENFEFQKNFHQNHKKICTTSGKEGSYDYITKLPEIYPDFRHTFHLYKGAHEPVSDIYQNNHLNKNYDTQNNKKNQHRHINYNNISNFNEVRTNSLFNENNIFNNNSISNGLFNNTHNNAENFNLSMNNNFKMKNSNIYNINSNDSMIKGLEFKYVDQIQKTQELKDFFLNSNRPSIQMDICEQIKFIIKQYDFYLQLILQNIFLTDDSDLKYRGYSLIYNMYLQKMRIINMYKLPHFEIYFNFCKIFCEGRSLPVRPQISFFQSPILEVLPIFVKFMKKTFSREEVTQIMKEFFPFINPLFLPINLKNKTLLLENNNYELAQQGLTLDEDEEIITKSISKNNESLLEKNNLIVNKPFSNNKQSFENNLKNDKTVDIEDQNSSKFNEDHENGNIEGNTKINKEVENLKNINDPEETSNFSREISKMLDFSNTNKISNISLLNKKRRKFDIIHDHLLMLGLFNHGKRNIDIIEKLWIFNKSNQEIRHRIKNLTCQKAPENVIKKIKDSNETPLSMDEFHLFLKGIQWFGLKKKWSLISRYFLKDRSPEYIEEFYQILSDEDIFRIKDYDSNELSKNKNDKLFRNNYQIIQNNKSSFEEKFIKRRKNDKLSSLIAKEIPNYLILFKDEIRKTFLEINSIESKNFFISSESRYEQLIMPDNIKAGNLRESYKFNNGLDNKPNYSDDIYDYPKDDEFLNIKSSEKNIHQVFLTDLKIKSSNLNEDHRIKISEKINSELFIKDNNISNKLLSNIINDKNQKKNYIFYNNMKQRASRHIGFDIHIRDADDSAFEKLIID